MPGKSERKLQYQAEHRKTKKTDSLKQSNSQSARQSSLVRPDEVKSSNYGANKFFVDSRALIKPKTAKAKNPFSAFLLPQVLLLLTAATEIMASSTTTVCFNQNGMDYAVTGEGLKWGWSPFGTKALDWLDGNDGRSCDAVITPCIEPIENTTAIANISTLTESDWWAALCFNPFNKGRAHIYGGNDTMTDGVSCLVGTADWQHDHRPTSMAIYYLVTSIVGISACCCAKHCGNPIKACKDMRSTYVINNQERENSQQRYKTFIEDSYLALNA